MPNRLIREGFLDSEAVNSLDHFTECIFHRLLIVSDDAGRFDGRTAIIAARCYPLKSIPGKDVGEQLVMLEEAGLLILYECHGKPFLQITKWQKCGKAITSKFPWSDGKFKIEYSKVETRDGVKDFVTTSLPHRHSVSTPSLPHSDRVQSKNLESNTETIYEDGGVVVDEEVTLTPSVEEELIKVQEHTNCEGLPDYLPDCPFKEIVDSFNHTLGSRLKLVQIPTFKRRAAIVEFWRLLDCSMEQVGNYWQKVRKSDYLLGKKSTKGPWRGTTFDWLVNTDNAVKVIEGNYDNEGRS